MDTAEINALKQAAWVHASAELAGIESRVKAKAKPDHDQIAVAELYADEMVPYLIAHLTRCEAVCALAVSRGILPPPLIGGLMAATRSFAQAAVTGRRAFCPPPCTWRGEVSEAGPVGQCPLCQHVPVQVLELATPGSGNGRILHP